MSVRLTVRAGEDVWAWAVDDWSALVALAAVSAEPESSSEFFAALRRYRPDHRWDETAQDAALDDASHPDGNWCLIDLNSRSVLAGDAFELPDRRGAYQADEDERGDGFHVVWLDTPDDWLFATAGEDWMQVLAKRARAYANRERVETRAVLFGRAMLQFIAGRTLAAATADADDERGDEQIRAIHAEWLTTPRDDLLNHSPRTVLLRDHRRIGLDMQHRSEQWSMQGHAPPALPEDSAAFRFGGYGTMEIVMYFDLMRSLLGHAWDWVTEHPPHADTDSLTDALVEQLAKHRDAFLDQPPEDAGTGLTCREMIASERRRMPITSDGSHLDCDCPICQATAEGAFGPGPTFLWYDGHHLELEDEFAFSMIESREEWERRQDEFRRSMEEMDRKRAGREASGEGPDSVWRTSFVDWDDLLSPSDAPIPAKLAIGFPLAELVTELQARGADQQGIDRLNAAFRESHRAEGRAAQRSAAEVLRACLEDVAQADPELTPRSADLQSRLDEILRADVSQPDPEPTRPPVLNVVVYRSPGPSDGEIERWSAQHVEDVSPRPLSGGLGYLTLEPDDFDRLADGVAAGDARGTAAAVLHFLGPSVQPFVQSPNQWAYCWTTTDATEFGRVLLLQVVPRRGVPPQ